MTRVNRGIPSEAKPSDELKHAHLVMLLFNMILAELCFFIIFFGYDAASSPGQAAIAVVLDEGIKWILLLVFSRLFRWAMAEPALPSFDAEDEQGWHLVFRQVSSW